jgi:hypothetical protein
VPPHGSTGCAPTSKEASADLGASNSKSIRFVIFPLMRSALATGGLRERDSDRHRLSSMTETFTH